MIAIGCENLVSIVLFHFDLDFSVSEECCLGGRKKHKSHIEIHEEVPVLDPSFFCTSKEPCLSIVSLRIANELPTKATYLSIFSYIMINYRGVSQSSKCTCV